MRTFDKHGEARELVRRLRAQAMNLADEEDWTGKVGFQQPTGRHEWQAADLIESFLSEGGAELQRLRDIEHYAWHLMDSSEEDATTGEVTIKPMREDYDTLSKLLPEAHPSVGG